MKAKTKSLFKENWSNWLVGYLLILGGMLAIVLSPRSAYPMIYGIVLGIILVPLGFFVISINRLSKITRKRFILTLEIIGIVAGLTGISLLAYKVFTGM